MLVTYHAKIALDGVRETNDERAAVAGGRADNGAAGAEPTVDERAAGAEAGDERADRTEAVEERAGSIESISRSIRLAA